MKANTSHRERQMSPDLKAGILRRVSQVVLMPVYLAAILFLSAGRLGWVWGWVLIGLYLLGISVSGIFMFHYRPETIAERGRGRGAKDWDKKIGSLWALMYFLLTPLTAGLDTRFGWSDQAALWVHIAGIAVFVLGFALFIWAMISNAYFSTVVRIQDDRGHTVCTHGPYRFIRHPGYTGAILQTLGIPLMLGSFWSLIPSGLAVLLMVARTVLEDRTLKEELEGYPAYARKVHHRLLPGIW